MVVFFIQVNAKKNKVMKKLALLKKHRKIIREDSSCV